MGWWRNGGLCRLYWVVKVQVGPTVVVLPSLTLTYHSYFVFGASPAQVMAALEPDATWSAVTQRREWRALHRIVQRELSLCASVSSLAEAAVPWVSNV